MKWEEICEGFFAIKRKVKDERYIFTLKKQEIGNFAMGLALVLRGQIFPGSQPEPIATFWIKDDTNNSYKTDSYKKKLWYEKEAIEEALQIIDRLVKVLED